MKPGHHTWPFSGEEHPVWVKHEEEPLEDYNKRMKEWITDMVREELEKYDGGFTDEWNDQRKKNAEVLGYKLSGKSDIKESKKKDSRGTVRDYKKEYAKYGSSKKAKKYRAELNKYNRQKGTYGNGDGKDASHKGGKIVGFEAQSKNRGRAEKSRLKKETISINGKKYESVNEDINDKMKTTMTKLAKSLGIKSVVSMHTGKGSLSYFIDDDREAKKLQKFLQRSFKRVRLISLDKSKGDTANWVVAADMIGLESVNENTDKAVKDMIKKRYVKKGQRDKDRVIGIGKWLDERAPKISAKYNDNWIRRIKKGRGGQVQDWWGDTMSMISVRLREQVENVNESGLAFAVILRNLAKHAAKKRMYDKMKKKKRESVNESEQDKIKQFLMKKGDNEKDATEKLKYYDMVTKMYKGVNSTKKAEIMTSLWANEAVNNPSFFDGESINERFRPSDRKTLMVVVRDTIDKLRKRNPDIDEPSKKLGQALNSILRAMTREKSDANYRQYKKYFPKYNDKLLRRLATAYFDEPYNVQNTFIRDAMKYSLKDVIPNLKLMSFYKYMADFYGKKGIYPDKKGRDLKVGDIDKALVAYKKKWGASEFEGDTLDRERVRDILIKMRKLDPDYSKKESVNEGVSKSQAQEIMDQLGGRKFEMLMGVKSKGIGKDGLILHIGKNPKRVSHIIIDLDRGRDLYNLTFGKIYKYQFKVIKKLKGIYVDQLHDMIEKYTGNLTTFRPRR